MLVEFRLRNYRCFKEEITLSMLAAPDDSLPQNTMTTHLAAAPRLLRSAVIYGSNASGKSTVLAALNFMNSFVSLSATREPDADILVTPFLLDESSATAPSDFEIMFIHNDIRYQYGFSVDASQVHGEWLYFWPKGREALLFRRKWDAEKQIETYTFGNLFKGQKESLRQATRANRLFLSVGATLNNPQLSEVYEWFKPGLQGLASNNLPFGWVADILKQEPYKRMVLELLKEADLSIVEYDIIETKIDLSEISVNLRGQQVPLDTEEGYQAKRFKVLMQHETRAGKLVELNLNQESEGTQRLFKLAAWIFKALEQGGIFYIDELDASMHPFLARAIIQMFHHPRKNPKNAQLIFNTHDVTLLDQDIFRRDQVWFTERQADGSSTLYSLVEFSPRKEERLDKGYLLGRYGGVPIISELGATYNVNLREEE